MNKKDNEDFLNSTKCWVFDNDCVNNDVDKVRDYCHSTGTFRGSGHRNLNNNLKLSHKISVVFHIPKNYDSCLILQELGKFSLRRKVIPSGLERYMSFPITNKLGFTNSFQFLSSLLDNLFKT